MPPKSRRKDIMKFFNPSEIPESVWANAIRSLRMAPRTPPPPPPPSPSPPPYGYETYLRDALAILTLASRNEDPIPSFSSLKLSPPTAFNPINQQAPTPASHPNSIASQRHLDSMLPTPPYPPPPSVIHTAMAARNLVPEQAQLAKSTSAAKAFLTDEARGAVDGRWDTMFGSANAYTTWLKRFVRGRKGRATDMCIGEREECDALTEIDKAFRELIKKRTGSERTKKTESLFRDGVKSGSGVTKRRPKEKKRGGCTDEERFRRMERMRQVDARMENLVRRIEESERNEPPLEEAMAFDGEAVIASVRELAASDRMEALMRDLGLDLSHDNDAEDEDP